MPSLGADMDEGTVLEWLVRPGDSVAKGDLVAVVDTDKAAVEVECFDSGVVEAILVEPGRRVPVGTPLAMIATGAPSAPTAVGRPSVEPARPIPTAPPQARVLASPPVRRLAHARGVDLAALTGTGPDGHITRADVERAAAAVPGGPAAGRTRRPRVSPYARRLAGKVGVDVGAVRGTGPGGAVRADDVRSAAEGLGPAVAAAAEAPAAVPHPRVVEGAPRAARAERPAAAERADAMRAAIARLMARSKREIPHYYLATTVDLSASMGWLRERNRELPVPQRLVPAAAMLKATALAAARTPQLNGFWQEDAFVPGGGVHLGVAVSLRGGGLVAPAIHDADRLDLPALMAALRDLVARARAGRLRRAEMADPTLTVTNLGDQGVESVHGVIYPPQVALVGFGKVVERPWAVDGLLGVRPVVTLTLAADHRASDGFTGARFLAAIDGLLQTPEAL